MSSQNKKPVEQDVLHEVYNSARHLEERIESLLDETDRSFEPLRKSVLKRFPTLFILLTTFGVATTFFGFERLVATYPILYERPWLILVVGISTLVLTGTLYKKLG